MAFLGVVCVCLFFFFDLLQDKMILIVFLSGLNLKLEKFHCLSPSSFSPHPLLPPSSSPLSLESDLVLLYTELLYGSYLNSTQKKKKIEENMLE